jgi:NADPH:quinone reductase
VSDARAVSATGPSAVEAWRVTGRGEPVDVFELGHVELPAPPPGQIRVRVAAAGVGFPDVAMCRGSYALTPPLPFTPGQELVGTVTAVGDGAQARVGDRVMAVSSFQYGHGSFARECLAGDDSALAVPDDMPDADAAGFHIPFHTGWVGLVRRAALQPGETLLVLGASGGSGSAAVLLGKALGATVIATAGGPEKAAHCAALGADHVVDHRVEAIAPRVRELTGGRGAQVVYDPVGGDAFQSAMRCIANEGRLLAVGFASGAWGAPSIPHMVQHNYGVLGVMPGRGYDRAAKEHDHAELLAHWRAGRLPAPIHGVFPFAQVPEAVTVLAEGRATGKVVVEVA